MVIKLISFSKTRTTIYQEAFCCDCCGMVLANQTHIIQGFLPATGAITLLSQHQRNNPDDCGQMNGMHSLTPDAIIWPLPK